MKYPRKIVIWIKEKPVKFVITKKHVYMKKYNSVDIYDIYEEYIVSVKVGLFKKKYAFADTANKALTKLIKELQ